jgi:hypothetical protein
MSLSLDVIFGLLLMWVTLIVTILTMGLTLSGSVRAAPVAKLCRVLAFVVAGAAILSAVCGVLQTRETLTAPGLSLADQQRLWSSGMAEALYNLGLGIVIAVPVWLAARFALKRAPAAAPD